MLGRQKMNIATFALGRREAVLGAEAVALVGLDGEVSDKVLPLLKATPNVIEARIIRLPALAGAASAAAD